LSRARWAFAQIWPRAAAVAGFVLIWWGISRTGYFDQVVLPSPGPVWDSLQDHVADGTIWLHLQKSLIRLGFGFAVAIVGGTVTGLLMVASSLVQRSIGSLVIGLQSLPSVSWLPLAILWFGLSERAVVFVVIIGAFPSVALATSSSLRQVPPLLERAGRTLGASGWRLYRSVIFPAAVPAYVGGLQQGWAFAWRSLMAGELILGARALGLGSLLERSRSNLDTETVLAVMLVIVAIGMAVDLLIFGALDLRLRTRRGLAARA
jgi:NitT/TauT family transport system permease protein